jgi:Domain of unknown function (DUF1707)
MAGLEDEMAAGGDRGRLRASRADREHVIDTLKAAYVYGLVTKDEFDARVSQTLASRTYAQLAVVTADIPAGLPAAPPPLRPAPAQASPPAHAKLEPGERAVVATAVLAGVLFVAAFFAGNANAIGGLVALGALGSALVSLFLAAQTISARRGARSGGQPPPRREVHSGPEARRRAAPAAPAEQLPHASKPRRPGNADAARRRRLRPQLSS